MFHNGSTYDYHFIIKELAEQFEGEFECLGKNTEKYIAFSVPIKKETTKKDNNGNDKITKIFYKIKFIDSCRFMSTSLSNLVSNLCEGLHNDRCIDCKSCLDYMTTKDEQLIFRCFRCKNNYEENFNKELIRRFANTYEFCNGDLINKYLDDYHDLYVQSDTLLLVDVFENFRNTCINVYEHDPAHFLSAPGLVWQTCLKKTEVKLELLTDVDMSLMVEKGIRGGICHAIYRYAKANNKYMKNRNEDKEESFLQYLDANNLYGWTMSLKLPVSGFKWKKNMLKFNEEFIKNYDEDSDKGYILEVNVKYPKNLHDLHSDLLFLSQRMKIGKCKKLVCNLYDKKTMLFT